MRIPASRIAVIILNYDDLDDTLGCLESLRDSSALDLRVVVVDNSEDAQARERLRSRVGDGVVYLESGGNLGYAAGNNVGIEFAMSAWDVEFIWLLNPDVRVSPGTAAGLLAAADATVDAAIIGCRIVYGQDPGRIWFDGGILDREAGGASRHLHSGSRASTTPPDGIRDVDYVTGACMLVRTAAIQDIGVIPEDYFLYFEETDYCLRAQRAGWRTVVDQSVLARHYKRSSGQLPTAYYLYYMTRNRLMFARRNYPDVAEDIVLGSFENSFLVPWRDRVASLESGWLDHFDHLVSTALDHARESTAGRWLQLAGFPPRNDEGGEPS